MGDTRREDRNQDATVYVGGLDDQVTETLVWELFIQAGPVVNVSGAFMYANSTLNIVLMFISCFAVMISNYLHIYQGIFLFFPDPSASYLLILHLLLVLAFLGTFTKR